jgi:hypothetical protein
MKPLVYVAGPITGNPFGCVRESMHAFTRLLDLGCTPFMPQWSVIGEMCHPLHYETWLDYDFDIIRHCSALVRLRGESPGADREVEHATALGLPVFHGVGDDRLYAWACRPSVPSPRVETPGQHEEA